MYKFYYHEDNTVLLPSSRVLIKIFVSLIECFLIPLFFYFYILNLLYFKKDKQILLKLSSMKTDYLIIKFTVFSLIMHSLLYLIFAINYYKNYYKIIFINLLCFTIVLYLNSLKYQMISLLISALIIIFISSDSLLFELNTNGTWRINRIEKIKFTIKTNNYRILFHIKNGQFISIAYKIFDESSLTKEELFLFKKINHKLTEINQII